MLKKSLTFSKSFNMPKTPPQGEVKLETDELFDSEKIAIYNAKINMQNVANVTKFILKQDIQKPWSIQELVKICSGAPVAPEKLQTFSPNMRVMTERFDRLLTKSFKLAFAHK